MQIHELNNFAGTLGSGTYLPVDNGSDTGKISTQQLLASTEARIDNNIAQVSELNGRVTATESAIDALESHKVAQPLDGNNQPTDGTNGQLLRTKGDGSTEWTDFGLPTDEQTAEAISGWLDNHPEATTTVQDNSLTEAKFTEALRLKTLKDYVTPEMFGAKGDGVTDDTAAIQSAIDTGNTVVFTNTYKVTSTIYLSGSKNLDIYGTIIYTGTGNLFYVYNHFNNIDGHNVGVLTGNGGNGTLICITTTAKDNTEVYSYYNKVLNITIRESAKGILLYNPETASASYFNTIEKCTIAGCPIGIELKGFADGNRLNNLVFYNCGVANDLSHASIVFTEENDKYPIENNISQIFVTNSPDTVCFLINGKSEWNIFSEIIVEAGGQSRSFYSTDYSKLRRLQIQIVDMSYLGGGFNLLDATNVLVTTGEVKSGNLSYKTSVKPLSRTACYSNDTFYGENAWIPLLKPTLSNLRSMRVSVVLYCYSAIDFTNQYYDELNTIVYNRNGYVANNTDKFKVEDGILYFKSPPVLNGGTPFKFKIDLTIGSYFTFAAGDVQYTMDSAWAQI